tara:strand:+ start:1133 stop:1612 length:480 start_codon:yes stop_codon:yes gene_type:complete
MYNAGILAYGFKNNEIVFLLGKDSKWKQWSDFGGKNDPIDCNVICKTATREFYEESIGVIYDIIQVNEYIKNAIYIKSKSYKNYDYYMYIMKIPYSMDYVNDFYTLKQFNLSIPQKYKEKTELRWFTLQEILKNTNEREMRSVFFKSVINNLEIFTNLK